MYNVRKGWPSNAAIDEVLKADTGATITDGMIVTVTDGKIAPANFTAAAAATFRESTPRAMGMRTV